MIEGGCQCGAVRFKVSGPLRDVIACHCRQCRRMSGHYFAATAARRKDVSIGEDGALAWFQSSETSRRGFCRVCGSSVFFDHAPSEDLSIAAGALDECADLRLTAHIYVDEAGEYYDLADGAEKMTREQWRATGWDGVRWRPAPPD